MRRTTGIHNLLISKFFQYNWINLRLVETAVWECELGFSEHEVYWDVTPCNLGLLRKTRKNILPRSPP